METLTEVLARITLSDGFCPWQVDFPVFGYARAKEAEGQPKRAIKIEPDATGRYLVSGIAEQGSVHLVGIPLQDLPDIIPFVAWMVGVIESTGVRP